MKNNNRVTKNQIRVLLAVVFMTVSAIPGRLISFIPNNFVDQYILDLVPILLVVFLFILLFTLEKKQEQYVLYHFIKVTM